ncbi:hypothetical protein ACJMK2_030656 [Sinanodonta woodiana]|uniref:Uncharacterized protein n=1 Tax=Sinanodonta woodiana TaxID=1069815 RepID=A0ABD3WY41_SINWO
MLQPVHRVDGVKEFFISERFIQSEQWNTLLRRNRSWPHIVRKYNYTKDYIKYNGDEWGCDLINNLSFSDIIHVTHQRALLSIIRDGGFIPGLKRIPDCTLDSFVWFGLKIGQEAVDALRDYYTTQCRMEKCDISGELGSGDNFHEINCRSIVNSPCFEPMSRYGEFKLTFEIQNVIEAYSQQFCLSRKPDFRILGTFIYKMEIMHTVLVCPPNTPGTKKYPLLDQSQTPVICEDPEKEGTFIWRPDSTGDKDTADACIFLRGPFRRWEHATFAFYVPAGDILKLDNVSSHSSVCIYVNPRKKYEESLINDTIHNLLANVSEESSIETRRWVVKLLIRSIRGYLDEEKVFEKMNILYTYQLVDLDTIVCRVEELLHGKEFDWSPLIEWMNDVQQTKNTVVLSSILKYLNNKTEICIATLRINDV